MAERTDASLAAARPDAHPTHSLTHSLASRPASSPMLRFLRRHRAEPEPQEKKLQRHFQPEQVSFPPRSTRPRSGDVFGRSPRHSPVRCGPGSRPGCCGHQVGLCRAVSSPSAFSFSSQVRVRSPEAGSSEAPGLRNSLLLLPGRPPGNPARLCREARHFPTPRSLSFARRGRK